MKVTTEIVKFASERQEFSRKELLENLSELPEKSILPQLYRLVKIGKLEKVGNGIYRLPISKVTVSKQIKQLYEMLKKQFPFANFCIWDSNFLIPYFHHIPNLNFIYIDVENDVTESAFNFLKSTLQKAVYYKPTKEEFERYISGTEAIIVRSLVSESPLQMVQNVQTATFEKMLVDIVGDTEFDFMQGAEIHYFYPNVLERRQINKSKLLRYASRRGRREEVEQLLNSAL